MTATTETARGDRARPPKGRWIDDWRPEDPAFWTARGARIARRNLSCSILAEHIGFSVWTLWSVLVLFLGPAYGIDPAGKFTLTAVPALAARPCASPTRSPSPGSAAATGRSSARHCCSSQRCSRRS